MDNQLVIRPFTAQDYEVYCAVNNSVYPDYPDTPEEVRHADKNREAKLKWARFVAEVNGKAVGTASYGQSSGAYHPHRFHIGVTVLPENEGHGIGSALFRHLVANLAPHQPDALMTQVREDWSRALRFVAERGFAEVMREQESRLDLAAFNPGEFAADLVRVSDQGIVLKSVAELSETDPNYRLKLYDLNWEVEQDIPHSEKLTRPSFDVWEKRFERPGYLPQAYFVALDGDKYVGLSQIWRAQATTDLFTGATGTLRDYRKRGLATALKIRALTWAKESGAPYIRTWNEVNNNGMLGINFRLGFVRLPQWIEFTNELKKDETK